MFLIILLCIVTAVYLWRCMKSSKCADLPPAYPGALPLIGHGHLLLGDTKHLWRFMNQFASYIFEHEETALMFYVGLHKICVVSDPDDCYTITTNCLRKNFIYDFAKPWLGDGLVTSPPPIWKRDRKLLSPSFNQQLLDGFISIFNSKSRLLVKSIESKAGKRPFDVLEYLNRISLETIYQTATGMELQSDNENDMKYYVAVEQTMHLIVQRFLKFWLHNDFLWQHSSNKVAQDKYLSSMRRFTDMIIKRRRLERSNDSSPDNDGRTKSFLDILLDLETESGKVMSDQAVREHMETIIVAGHDTTSTTLLYTLVLIGSYPKVQERLYTELQEIYGNEDRDVEKQDFSRLVYLDAVLKESMRFYPILPLFARHVDKEVRLKNYTLHPGMSCIIMAFGVHRHSAWGRDANEFNPDRWLNPHTLPENSNFYVPFSLGKRTCFGSKYAMISMKTTLVHFLRYYRVTADHTKMVLKMNMLLKPDSGHHVAIEQRK